MSAPGQEHTPYRKWVNESVLSLGSVVAILTVIFIIQLTYLAVRYERRGLDKMVVRFLLSRYVYLFLGCGFSVASMVGMVHWCKDDEWKGPYNIQVLCSFVPPLLFSVSIFTTLSLSKMKKIGEETKNVVEAIKGKWAVSYLLYSLPYFQLVFPTMARSFGRFLKKDDFCSISSNFCQAYESLESSAGGAVIFIIFYTFMCGTTGLVFSLSLPSLISIVTKCIILYGFYQEKDSDSSDYAWYLNYASDALAVIFLLIGLIVSTMHGSVFYAAYQFAQARKKAPLEERTQIEGQPYWREQ